MYSYSVYNIHLNIDVLGINMQVLNNRLKCSSLISL